LIFRAIYRLYGRAGRAAGPGFRTES